MKALYRQFSHFSYFTGFVFSFLILTRVAIWLSIDWPESGVDFSDPNDRVVKINYLPVYFMVYWPDSIRYWPTITESWGNSFLTSLSDPDWNYLLPRFLFFLPRLLNDNLAMGVLFQNILSLLSAWFLYKMLRSYGAGLAAGVVLFSFSNLFTLSMEYALLREVFARFFLILSIYFLLDLIKSPNWKILLSASCALFISGWCRPELMLVPFLAFPLIYWKIPRNLAIIFLIFGILGLISHKKVEKFSGQAYTQFHDNLLINSFDYESPDLKDLPGRIYSQGKKCENLFKISCQLPSFRYNQFRVWEYEAIDQWIRENPNFARLREFEGATARDQNYNRRKVIFLDVLKNNPVAIFHSSAYSLWSYLTGRLFTISPLIYSGSNQYIKNAWIHYSSPNLDRFNDPLSEFKPEDRGSPWILKTLKPFSEFWMRNFFAPFYIMGIFIACRQLIFKNKGRIEIDFWTFSLVLTVMYYLISSIVGVRGSRRAFAFDPFMISIGMLNLRVLWTYSSLWLVRFTGKKSPILAAGALALISVLLFLRTPAQHAPSPPAEASPFAEWDMDADSNDRIADSLGKHPATSHKTRIIEGYSGKAREFNGIDAYIQTSLRFNGWQAVQISFWVKPEKKEGNALSVILDNGHGAQTDFAIQSVDASGERWVWHCNGIDLFLDIPLNRWTHVMVSADAENGIMRSYLNGNLADEVPSGKPFKFGSSPLTFGKLTHSDERYFKGSIDEIKIWNQVFDVP